MQHNKVMNTMENIIRQIIQCMTKEPAVKRIIEDELQRNDQHQNEINFSTSGTIALSKLTITSEARLILNDYNTEINIQGYQARTLYLFYLLFPSGISNNELSGHTELMKQIYTLICKHNSNDEYRTDTFINGLFTRKGGISDATHKITRAVKDAITNKDAIHYYLIQGKRAGKRYVMLPKQLITVENTNLQNIIIQMIDSKNIIN